MEHALTIGPFSAVLSGFPEALIPSFQERYLGFVLTAGEQSESRPLRLRLRSAGREGFLSQVGDDRGWYQLRARASGGKIVLTTHNSAGWFDPIALEGDLALCHPGWDGLQLPLENLLRFYYAWRAVDRGGFLIHSASVVVEGRAFVFFGHSETGKTEVAEGSRSRGPVLSDDLTLLTLEADGYRAHSVPFRGRFRERLVTERRTYPVAGFFHLVRAGRNAVIPRPLPLSAAALYSCIPFVTEASIGLDPARIMQNCQRVLGAHPACQLEFTAGREIWDVILGAMRSGSFSPPGAAS